MTVTLDNPPDPLSEDMIATSSYPIYLDLTSRSCVVIGGKPFMVRKVQALLRAGAIVTVISPEPCPDLIAMAEQGEILLSRRGYHTDDLEGAFLALSADRDHAEMVRQEAARRGTLLNTINQEDSDFTLPAVLQRGTLSIAISTSGVFPAFAVRVRDELGSQFGPEYAQYLEWLALARTEVMQHVQDYEQRKRLWYAIIDSDVLDLLKQGNEATAWEHLCAILEQNRPDAS